MQVFSLCLFPPGSPCPAHVTDIEDKGPEAKTSAESTSPTSGPSGRPTAGASPEPPHTTSADTRPVTPDVVMPALSNATPETRNQERSLRKQQRLFRRQTEEAIAAAVVIYAAARELGPQGRAPPGSAQAGDPAAAERDLLFSGSSETPGVAGFQGIQQDTTGSVPVADLCSTDEDGKSPRSDRHHKRRSHRHRPSLDATGGSTSTSTQHSHQRSRTDSDPSGKSASELVTAWPSKRDNAHSESSLQVPKGWKHHTPEEDAERERRRQRRALRHLQPQEERLDEHREAHPEVYREEPREEHRDERRDGHREKHADERRSRRRSERHARDREARDRDPDREVRDRDLDREARDRDLGRDRDMEYEEARNKEPELLVSDRHGRRGSRRMSHPSRPEHTLSSKDESRPASRKDDSRPASRREDMLPEPPAPTKKKKLFGLFGGGDSNRDHNSHYTTRAPESIAAPRLSREVSRALEPPKRSSTTRESTAHESMRRYDEGVPRSRSHKHRYIEYDEPMLDEPKRHEREPFPDLPKHRPREAPLDVPHHHERERNSGSPRPHRRERVHRSGSTKHHKRETRRDSPVPREPEPEPGPEPEPVMDAPSRRRERTRPVHLPKQYEYEEAPSPRRRPRRDSEGGRRHRHRDRVRDDADEERESPRHHHHHRRRATHSDSPKRARFADEEGEDISEDIPNAPRRPREEQNPRREERRRTRESDARKRATSSGRSGLRATLKSIIFR